MGPAQGWLQKFIVEHGEGAVRAKSPFRGFIVTGCYMGLG